MAVQGQIPTRKTKKTTKRKNKDPPKTVKISEYRKKSLTDKYLSSASDCLGSTKKEYIT